MLKKDAKVKKSHFTHSHKKEINSFIGSRIKIIRLAVGMTKSELAMQVGITYQQLSNYENAKSSITIDRLFKIAKSFDMQIISLLPTTEEMKKIKI